MILCPISWLGKKEENHHRNFSVIIPAKLLRWPVINVINTKLQIFINER